MQRSSVLWNHVHWNMPFCLQSTLVATPTPPEHAAVHWQGHSGAQGPFRKDGKTGWRDAPAWSGSRNGCGSAGSTGAGWSAGTDDTLPFDSTGIVEDERD